MTPPANILEIKEMEQRRLEGVRGTSDFAVSVAMLAAVDQRPDPVRRYMCLVTLPGVPNLYQDEMEVTLVRRTQQLQIDDAHQRAEWVATHLEPFFRNRLGSDYVWAYSGFDGHGNVWWHLAVKERQNLQELADALCSAFPEGLPVNVMVRAHSFTCATPELATFNDELWAAVGQHPEREAVLEKLYESDSELLGARSDPNVIGALVGPAFEPDTDRLSGDKLAIWVLLRSRLLWSAAPAAAENLRINNIAGTPVLYVEATSHRQELVVTEDTHRVAWDRPRERLIGTRVVKKLGEYGEQSCSLGPPLFVRRNNRSTHFWLPAHTFPTIGEVVYAGPTREQIGRIVYSDTAADVAVVELTNAIRPLIKVTADDTRCLPCLLTDGIDPSTLWGKEVHKSGGVTGLTTGHLATFGLVEDRNVHLTAHPEPRKRIGFVYTKRRAKFQDDGDCGGPVFVLAGDDGNEAAQVIGVVNMEIQMTARDKDSAFATDFAVYGFTLYSDILKHTSLVPQDRLQQNGCCSCVLQ